MKGVLNGLKKALDWAFVISAFIKALNVLVEELESKTKGGDNEA